MRGPWHSRLSSVPLLMLLVIVIGTIAPLAPVHATDESPATSDPTATPTDVPVSPTDVPIVPTDVPPVPTDVPVVPTDEPAIPTDEPPGATDIPAEPTDVPAIPTDIPIVPTDVPAALADEPPATPASQQRMGTFATQSLTITKTVSDDTPALGDIIIFEVTVSGTLPSGAVVAVSDWYGDEFESDIRDLTVVGDPEHPYTVVATNASLTGTLEDFSVPGTVWYRFDFTVQGPEGGLIDFQIRNIISMRVDGNVWPGKTVITFADTYVREGADALYNQVQTDLTVGDSEPAHALAITKTASDTTPAPGDTVSFEIVITGILPGGTTLVITDLYSSPAMMLSGNPAPYTLTMTNVSRTFGPRHTVAPGQIAFEAGFATVDGPGNVAFRVSLTVDLPVAASAVPSATIHTAAIASVLPEGSGLPTSTVGLDLTVGEPEIEHSLTITRTVSEDTPLPGDIIDFEIVIAGDLPAGTGVEFVDEYEAPFLELTRPVSEAYTTDATLVSGPIDDSDGFFTRFRSTFTVDGTAGTVVPFSVTFTISMQVAVTTHPGTVIATNASTAMVDGNETSPTAQDTRSLQVIANPVPPTVTMSVSSTAPAPGSGLTYTISVSGSDSHAGTVLTLTDVLPPSLTPIQVVAETLVNVGQVTGTGTDLTSPLVIGATVQSSQIDFQAVFLIEVSLAPEASPGTEIVNEACVDIAYGPQDACASTTVTVTAPVTTTPPVLTTTIAPTSPRLGERVSITIQVSGTAAAGATFALAAETGSFFLPTRVTTGAMANVGDVAIATGFPSHITFTVPEAGAWEASFLVEAWVSFATPRDTDLVATACVTAGDETAPVCSSDSVQRQPTFAELLLDRLLAILRGLLGW